jgi:hypothetical protein
MLFIFVNQRPKIVLFYRFSFNYLRILNEACFTFPKSHSSALLNGKLKFIQNIYFVLNYYFKFYLLNLKLICEK